jgi:hypothetical protein
MTPRKSGSLQWVGSQKPIEYSYLAVDRFTVDHCWNHSTASSDFAIQEHEQDEGGDGSSRHASAIALRCASNHTPARHRRPRNDAIQFVIAGSELVINVEPVWHHALALTAKSPTGCR